MNKHVTSFVLGCMEIETDILKWNVSKRGNVIFDFLCFGNVLETSINIYIYNWLIFAFIFIMFTISYNTNKQISIIFNHTKK